MTELLLWVMLGTPMPVDVVNLATVPIEAFHARLEGLDAHGRVKVLAVRTADAFPAEFLVGAGRSRRVWLRGDVGQLAPGSARVVIDAVLFTDGKVAGPNRFRLDKYVAMARAVNGEIALAIGGMSREDALAWLRARVKEHEGDYPRKSADGADPSWRGWFWLTSAQSFLTVGESSEYRLRRLIEKAKQFGEDK